MKQVNTNLELRFLISLFHVSAIIRNKGLYNCERGAFTTPAHIEIYDKVREFLSSKKLPDIATFLQLTDISNDARLLLNTQVEPLHADDFEPAAATLEEYRKARLLVKAMASSAVALEQEDNTRGAEQSLETALIEVRKSSARSNIRVIGQDSELDEPNLEKGNDDALIPTGFRLFDSACGGVARSEVIVLAGYRGHGKSAIALNIALNAYARCYSCGIVSLEMPISQIEGRIWANTGLVDHTKIRMKDCTIEEVERIKRGWKMLYDHGQINRCRLVLHDPTFATPSDIHILFKPLNLDVLVIDYLGLCSVEGITDDWRIHAEGTKQFKQIAKDLNVVLVLLAQSDERERTRYARAIEEHADFVWWFMRDEEQFTKRIVRIKQTKTRDIAPFNFALKEQFEYMMVTDYMEEAYEDRN